jgi:hypothetical protein
VAAKTKERLVLDGKTLPFERGWRKALIAYAWRLPALLGVAAMCMVGLMALLLFVSWPRYFTLLSYLLVPAPLLLVWGYYSLEWRRLLLSA